MSYHGTIPGCDTRKRSLALSTRKTTASTKAENSRVINVFPILWLWLKPMQNTVVDIPFFRFELADLVYRELDLVFR